MYADADNCGGFANTGVESAKQRGNLNLGSIHSSVFRSSESRFKIFFFR